MTIFFPMLFLYLTLSFFLLFLKLPFPAPIIIYKHWIMFTALRGTIGYSCGINLRSWGRRYDGKKEKNRWASVTRVSHICVITHYWILSCPIDPDSNHRIVYQNINLSHKFEFRFALSLLSEPFSSAINSNKLWLKILLICIFAGNGCTIHILFFSLDLLGSFFLFNAWKISTVFGNFLFH